MYSFQLLYKCQIFQSVELGRNLIIGMCFKATEKLKRVNYFVIHSSDSSGNLLRRSLVAGKVVGVSKVDP